jgi:hypothetical protein
MQKQKMNLDYALHNHDLSSRQSSSRGQKKQPDILTALVWHCKKCTDLSSRHGLFLSKIKLIQNESLID